MLQKLEGFVRIPDWRLTTAEILYHLPDHPAVLQTFIWQKLGPQLSQSVGASGL